MNRCITLASVALLWLLAIPSIAAVNFVRQGPAPQLIELYTSQGCSSCPQADRWLNKFTHKDDLWERFVPVAFHVDYWNYLGWPDTLSAAAYSARQRAYKRAGRAGGVYTPGFFVNGREWRGYFMGARLPKANREEAGQLQLVQNNIGNMMAIWRPVKQDNAESYVGNLAVMGFGIETHIKAGENRNQTVDYNFAVLHFAVERLQSNKKKGQWAVSFTLPEELQSAVRYGLAVWVTATDDTRPLQAVGGWADLVDLVASQ